MSVRMQSRIGCICLAFLHCEFSNVESRSLDQSRQSHIDCNSLTFFHCAFSNVSSNRLLQKRHSRISCICLTFLHCEFLNVSSNSMPLHCSEDEKSHKCSQCDFASSRVDDLKTNLKTHSGEKSNKCYQNVTMPLLGQSI